MDRLVQSRFEGAVSVPEGGDWPIAADQGSELGALTRPIPSGWGVALFAGAGDQPILLLQGGRLRELVRRRLVDPEPEQRSRRTRLAPVTERVWFRGCGSRFEAEWLVFQLVRGLFPDQLAEYFPQLGSWFVQVDLTMARPRVKVTDQVNWSQGRYWGPLPSKKKAQALVDRVGRLFGVCRCVAGEPGREASEPNPGACPYAQMGHCAASVDGVFSEWHYRRSVEQVVGFLDRPMDQSLSELATRMRELAEARQFEQAQLLKQDYLAVRELQGGGYRWLRGFDAFYLVSFQRGPRVPMARDARKKETMVQPFLVSPWGVHVIEPFRPGDAAVGCRAILDHYHLLRFQSASGVNPVDLPAVGWVTQFLYGRAEPAGLYSWLTDATTEAELMDALAGHFSISRQADESPEVDPSGVVDESPGGVADLSQSVDDGPRLVDDSPRSGDDGARSVADSSQSADGSPRDAPER